MLRRAVLLLVLCVSASGATIRLYLKDGTYQLAREYEVAKDRIRYYSTERGEWEEIPLELVDLNRTRKEAAEREDAAKADSKVQSEEDAAERAAVKEVERIPMEPGVYYIDGDKLDTLKLAESKIVNNKRRSILSAISPVPLIAGKATVELDGESSEYHVSQDRPEFYFRLGKEERFAIIRLTPKKGVRVVENLQIIPLTKQTVEEMQEVATFKKQSGDLLFKIWPEKPLDPGEYAVIEHTPLEEDSRDKSINLQVWDFSVGPVTKPAPHTKR